MSDKPIHICQLCRRRVYRLRNGEWYHELNGSAFCYPGDGRHRKALPLTISTERARRILDIEERDGE
jgi:hypothetical protein